MSRYNRWGGLSSGSFSGGIMSRDHHTRPSAAINTAAAEASKSAKTTLMALRTHGGNNKMADILQMTFSNRFSWKKFIPKFNWHSRGSSWRWKWIGPKQARSHKLKQWLPTFLMNICVTTLNELTTEHQHTLSPLFMVSSGVFCCCFLFLVV